MKKNYLSLLPISIAHAATSGGIWDLRAFDFAGLSVKSPGGILLFFVSWSISIIGLLGIIAFIYAGYTYLVAGNDADKAEQTKKIILYSVIGIIVSILGLATIKTVSDLMDSHKNTNENIAGRISPSTQSISELVSNSQNTGQVSAVIPKNTSLEEIQKALQDLPEGKTISFTASSSEGAFTVLTFKKENGQVNLVYIDNDRLKGLSKSTNDNQSSYFDSLIKTAKADDLLTSGTLSKDQLVSVLTSLLNLLQSNDNNVITMITDPYVNDFSSPFSFSETVSRCISTGGIWYRFTNSCTAQNSRCNSTTNSNCSTLGINPVESCQCADGECTDRTGNCVAISNTNSNTNTNTNTNTNSSYSDSSSDNPCFNATLCTNYGGYWNGSNQSNIECRCLSLPLSNVNTNTNSWSGSRENYYKGLCENSGGTWDNSWFNNGPRLFSDGTNQCSCSCNGCSCWGTDQAQISDSSALQTVVNSTGAADYLSQCSTNFYFNPNISRNFFGGFHFPGKKHGTCTCSTGKVLDGYGKCVDTSNNTEVSACTNSGGAWTLLSGCCGREKQKCGSDNLICSCLFDSPQVLGCACPDGQCVDGNGQCKSKDSTSEKITCENSGGTWIAQGGNGWVRHICHCPDGKYLDSSSNGKCTDTTFPTSSCHGKVDIGKMLGQASWASCIDIDTLKSNCTSSNGQWMNYGQGYHAMYNYSHDYPSNFCGKSTSAFYKQENCDGPDGPCSSQTYPWLGCRCPGSQCLDSQGKCTGNIGDDTTFTDCKSDYQCFYKILSGGGQAKLTISEMNYFRGSRIKETSEIRGIPNGSGFDVTMTVLNLERMDQNKSLASGVISDDTLNQCPNLLNNLYQIEGKSTTCKTGGTTTDCGASAIAVCTPSISTAMTGVRYLVQNGLTNSNITNYSCQGNLITKMKEICGTPNFPEGPVAFKPAIYLYPQRNIEVGVTLGINGEIIKSDPEYPQNGWKVKATPSSLIDGKYDYLFYENTLNKLDLPKEGWVVKKEDLNQWFNDNLQKLGLNEKESAQFKEYWLGVLNKANYYEIKLLSDQYLKENMNLKISPQPDTVIRRNFYFKPLQEKTDLKEPIIITPERKGFTVVEWGGIMD